jgi:hypothetical protein
MDVLLAVETNPSYAKPPAIFYLVATISTILYWLYLRWRLRRKQEKERGTDKPKSNPDPP